MPSIPRQEADPRGNGETIPIYSIAPSKLGVIDNHRYNTTENGRQYHGIDFSMNSRFRNGTQLQGGITTGKLHEEACQVDDPNRLRYCDASYPFLTQFKLSGTYALPYGFRLSGLLQNLPGVQCASDAGNVGKDLAIQYSVGRAMAPGLTLVNLEVDVIAKYVERLLGARGGQSAGLPGVQGAGQ